ncbi:hypothetical protein GJ496_005723 [Pomphorhynchus laevis]|nr:hypothetical protein GJ496_005723 [Pomphorhynchus laevis]
MGKKNPFENLNPDLISEEQLRGIYSVSTKPCKRGSCRRNCVSNLRCLNGLGEKSYDIDLEQKWETRLTEIIRKSNEHAGLKNIGATCYANSYIQVWMHNPVFRNVIMSQEIFSDVDVYTPELDEETISSKTSTFDDFPKDLYIKVDNDLLLGLQAVFTLLRHSKRRYVNPDFLLRSLRLDGNRHQDAQEFSSLFLNLLENEFSLQGRPNFVNDMFQSHLLYSIKCLSCGASSSSSTEFKELQLPVHGYNSLMESLDSFFKDEKLSDDNQYYCCSCQQNTDAVRSSRILRTSDIFSVQLMRFVFDRQTGKKRKVCSRIRFPTELNLKSYLFDDSNSDDCLYDLTALVLHIGKHTTSGHFIVQVRYFEPVSSTTNTCQIGSSNSMTDDNITSSKPKSDDIQWLEIDDHNVKQIFRCKNVGDNEILTTKDYIETSVDFVKSQCKLDDDTDISEPKRKHRKSTSGVDFIKMSNKDDYLHPSTSNGYMFVYTRRSALRTARFTEPILFSTQMQNVLQLDNDLVDQWISKHETSAENALSDKVRQIIDALFSDENDQLYFIDTLSLKVFYNHPANEDSKLTCERCPHGGVGLHSLQFRNPNRNRKLIPIDAIKIIDNVYPFNLQSKLPTVNDICKLCVQEYCRYLQLKKKYLSEHKALQLKMRSAIEMEEPTFYIGRMSFRNWQNLKLSECTPSFFLKEKCDESADAEDNDDFLNTNGMISFNEDLYCQHRKLTPCRSKKMLVSGDVWKFFRFIFPFAPEWATDTEVCFLCQNDMENIAREEEDLKNIGKEERVRFAKILENQNLDLPAIIGNNRVFLISIEFFDEWKRFLKSSKSGRPSMIRNQTLLCEHNLLSFYPKFPSKHCVWISNDAWSDLCERYNFDREIFVNYTVSGEEGDVLYHSISFNPVPCKNCISDHDVLTNTNESEIELHICKASDISRTNLRDVRSNINGRNRRSNLLTILKVKPTDSVRDIKLKIAAALYTMVSDQHLMYNNQELRECDPNGLPLTVMSIPLTDKCDVFLQTDLPDNMDNESRRAYVDEHKSTEKGFKGTALSS